MMMRKNSAFVYFLSARNIGSHQMTVQLWMTPMSKILVSIPATSPHLMNLAVRAVVGYGISDSRKLLFMIAEEI